MSQRLVLMKEIYNTHKKGKGKTNSDYEQSCLYYFLGTIKYVGKH